MSNKKGAVLIPESQLTETELEEVAGGLSLLNPLPLGPSLSPTFPTVPRFQQRINLADDCGTSDSGAMGCPG